MIPPAVSALADAWAAWEREASFPYDEDCCINATRVATRVLDSVGVRARPLSVWVLLLNQFALELAEADVAVSDWPNHAWSVGVQPGLAPPGQWNGHLIAEGDGWALDLSARQFHRPGKLIVDKPWVLPAIPTEGRGMFRDPHAQTLYVVRNPANNRWRTAPGWRSPNTEAFRRLLADVRRALPENQ